MTASWRVVVHARRMLSQPLLRLSSGYEFPQSLEAASNATRARRRFERNFRSSPRRLIRMAPTRNRRMPAWAAVSVRDHGFRRITTLTWAAVLASVVGAATVAAAADAATVAASHSAQPKAAASTSTLALPARPTGTPANPRRHRHHRHVAPSAPSSPPLLAPPTTPPAPPVGPPVTTSSGS